MRAVENRIRFFVPGPLPGMNEMIDEARAHWGQSHKSRQMWIEHIYNIIGAVPKYESIHVHFHWLEKDKRRDPDNIAAGKKLIMDGMVATGLISNDGWIQIKGFQDTFEVDKKKPGVLVTVTEV